MSPNLFVSVGQSARSRLRDLAPRISTERRLPLSMMISQQGKINHGRLAVILFSICTVVLGVILSFVPWLDYIIFRELKLWNGSISYSYWQKPGVMRLTKVYIFNVTNSQAFLENGEKPKLVEVGPFVYREDMEKVNIKFHDNDTVTFQHKKILRFVPEMSADKNQPLVVPNIPYLSALSLDFVKRMYLGEVVGFITGALHQDRGDSFVKITAEELVFGYEDRLVSFAHIVYPKNIRPNKKMGLLLARNGTLEEVSTIYTGQQSMKRFGYLDKVNGLDQMTYWTENSKCNNIRASEGSFFPPRDSTKEDIVNVYDKDLCRILPLKYRKDVYKDGIKTGLYTLPSSTFESADVNPDNKCFCESKGCPPSGLQNISPCQYNAPVYLSNPHFYQADPSLLTPVEGLKPDKKKHETYFLIQPKIGVPLEGFVRVQLNLKIPKISGIFFNNVNKFPEMYFPIMWIEEGIPEVTTPIWRWIFLATTVGPIAAPMLAYTMIFGGLLTISVIFLRAYKRLVLGQNTLEILDINKDVIRNRNSTIVLNSSKIVPTTYQPLNKNSSCELLNVGTTVSRSFENLRKKRTDFVKSTFSEVERESLLNSNNAFIVSETRK